MNQVLFLLSYVLQTWIKASSLPLWWLWATPRLWATPSSISHITRGAFPHCKAELFSIGVIKLCEINTAPRAPPTHQGNPPIWAVVCWPNTPLMAVPYSHWTLASSFLLWGLQSWKHEASSALKHSSVKYHKGLINCIINLWCLFQPKALLLELCYTKQACMTGTLSRQHNQKKTHHHGPMGWVKNDHGHEEPES